MSYLPLANLSRRPGRSALTALGVLLSIFLATTMFSIGEGLDRGVEELLNRGGVDIYVTQEDYPVYLQDYSYIRDCRNITSQIARHENVKDVSPWLIDSVFIMPRDKVGIKPSEQEPTLVAATARGYVPALNGDMRNVEIVEGRGMPTPDDPFHHDLSLGKGPNSDSFTHELLVNRQLADLLNIRIGERVFVFVDLDSGGVPMEQRDDWVEFTVHGIVREPFESDSTVSLIMHLGELQHLVSADQVDPCTKILVTVNDRSERFDVKEHVDGGSYSYNQTLTATTTDEFHREIVGMSQIFDGFSRTILVITFAVTLLFVSTVMMISARERKKEVGTLKAIGISNRTIVTGLLFEAVIICAVGLVFGVILGWIGSDVLDGMLKSSVPDMPKNINLVYFTPMVVIRASLTAFVVGVVSGTVPLLYATRVRPAPVMRGE